MFVPLVGENEQEEILAVWRKDQRRNPALLQFLSTLRDTDILEHGSEHTR